VAEVFAGFVIGFAIALFVSPLAAFMIVASNERAGLAQRIAPPGTSVIALAVVLNLAAVLLFTALGMVLGMALAGIEDRRPAGGLGSPNAVYSVLVVAIVAIAVLPMMALPALRRPAALAALVIAALFGWAMPWLASLRD
jgi:hypothetical protein